MSNSLGIQGYDYVEFYVGSAKMVAYWYAKAMGFKITGYRGPETGVRDRISYYLTQNDIKIVVTSAVKPTTSEINSFVSQHGDGVKRFSFAVENVANTYSKAIKNGAISAQSPSQVKDKNGYIDEAFIRIYDDTELGFINRDHYKGVFKPGYEKAFQDYEIQCENTGLQKIDHIVGNVRVHEMDKWADYFNKSLDFETFIEFGPGDISTKYSALLSKVVRSRDSVIKIPINEPYQGLRKSQIEEYIEEYQGSGVQHIAIETHDILSTIPALRKNGIEFLSVPNTYYKDLRKRNLKIDENIDDLEKNGILCDFEGKGYLLQLFTKPIGDRPTFFFEIIQRRYKSEGFGKGNFKSLFEAIEAEQERRGNL